MLWYHSWITNHDFLPCTMRTQIVTVSMLGPISLTMQKQIIVWALSRIPCNFAQRQSSNKILMRRLHHNQKSLIEYSVRTKWGTRSLTHEPFGEPYPYHPGRVRTGWHTNSYCWNNIMLMCEARIRWDTRLCTLRWSWGDRSIIQIFDRTFAESA